MRLFRKDLFHLFSRFGLRRLVPKLRSGIARGDRVNFPAHLPLQRSPGAFAAFPSCCAEYRSLQAFNSFRGLYLRPRSRRLCGDLSGRRDDGSSALGSDVLGREIFVRFDPPADHPKLA